MRDRRSLAQAALAELSMHGSVILVIIGHGSHDPLDRLDRWVDRLICEQS